MRIQEEIRSKLEEFKDLCSSMQVRVLYAFGSSTTNSFDDELSDIDLLVEIDEADPIEKGEKLMSLWDQLETFFQRKVDLLTDASIKNPVLRKTIDTTKVKIYDGEKSEILI